MKNQKRTLSLRYRTSRTTLIAVSLIMCMVLMVGCGGGKVDGENGKTIELKLAHFWPVGHPVETELVQPWAKEINEATNGQVIIHSYPGETLLKANDVYSGVVNGGVDFGLSCFSYTPGQFPFCDIFELPGITYNSAAASGRTAWEAIQEFNPQEVQDTKLLMVFSTGPGDLFTKTPVNNLNDLKGMEIRATGSNSKTLSALGATPVTMSQAEAYDAISRGVVKGNLGPDEILKGWNQAEITNYIVKTPFLYNTLFFFTMNNDSWAKLDPETQEIILEISEKYFEEVAVSLWDKQNKEALEWAKTEKGMEVIELTTAETARWHQAVAPLHQEWVKSIKEKGIDGDAVLKRIEELAKKNN